MLLEAIADFIADVLATIKQWEKGLLKALDGLGKALIALADEIAQLIDEMEAAFGKAMDSFEALLETLSNSSMRSALKAQVVDELYSDAKSILKQNPLYKALPREFRSAVKSLLKDTIRGLVNRPIVDPVLDVIGEIAGALDDVVDDVRSLDPDRPLDEQVLELVLSRIEDAVRDHFGSTKPRITVGFSFSYEFFGHHSVSFDLGRVDIPFSTFFGSSATPSIRWAGWTTPSPRSPRTSPRPSGSSSTSKTSRRSRRPSSGSATGWPVSSASTPRRRSRSPS